MGGELGDIVIGWREIVLGLIAVVALYMLVVVLRMQRLRGKAAAQAAAVPAPPPEPALAAEPPTPLTTDDAAPAWAAPVPQPLFMQGVEAEVVQLREEVDALRSEVAALRDELHNEIAHMRATQTVSPLYSDAMQMATLGHDAATIAERCGISRAEAELMLALVKNQEQ